MSWPWCLQCLLHAAADFWITILVTCPLWEWEGKAGHYPWPEWGCIAEKPNPWNCVDVFWNCCFCEDKVDGDTHSEFPDELRSVNGGLPPHSWELCCRVAGAGRGGPSAGGEKGAWMKGFERIGMCPSREGRPLSLFTAHFSFEGTLSLSLLIKVLFSSQKGASCGIFCLLFWRY